VSPSTPDDAAAGAAASSPYLCIAGPTAAGKSAAAMAVAAALRADGLPVEIVSVDSALVYRGMDIGTAKPSAADRAAVPHHLVDIVDPAEAYSAARFVADASACIESISARGALPLLVGGTMLYFKALFDGLDALPAADAAVRAAIDARAALEGWPALHAELARLDPPTAARLAPNDGQRIQRALEVVQLSGRPLSAWHTGPKRTRTPPLIALEPDDRAWLHGRIEQRFAAMLASGFIDEVRALRARPELHAELPGMRAVGYRQAWQALERGDLARLPASAVAATRQLAKRQLTWLRKMPERRVVACDPDGATDAVVRLARAFVRDGLRGRAP
jgi:tRNA dimethylallyltransferase